MLEELMAAEEIKENKSPALTGNAVAPEMFEGFEPVTLFQGELARQREGMSGQWRVEDLAV